jgi:hypothetical protein
VEVINIGLLHIFCSPWCQVVSLFDAKALVCSSLNVNPLNCKFYHYSDFVQMKRITSEYVSVWSKSLANMHPLVTIKKWKFQHCYTFCGTVQCTTLNWIMPVVKKFAVLCYAQSCVPIIHGTCTQLGGAWRRWRPTWWDRDLNWSFFACPWMHFNTIVENVAILPFNCGDELKYRLQVCWLDVPC